MSVERASSSWLDAHSQQSPAGAQASAHIRKLYADLDAKDALIRAGDAYIEAKDNFQGAEEQFEYGSSEWASAFHKMEAAQAAYQSLRKP